MSGGYAENAVDEHTVLKEREKLNNDINMEESIVLLEIITENLKPWITGSLFTSMSEDIVVEMWTLAKPDEVIVDEIHDMALEC